MIAPVILVIGTRNDRIPSGLAGIFAGSTYEYAPPDSVEHRDAAAADRELIEQFSHYCTSRGASCIWLRHMKDAEVTTRYDLSGASLTLDKVSGFAGQTLQPDAIKGVWYRGLPSVPVFASDDDRSYAERETEAVWEGYCHHTPTPVLNRPRTLGLRPALWEKFLLRDLVRTALNLSVPREGLTAPEPHPGARCRTMLVPGPVDVPTTASRGSSGRRGAPYLGRITARKVVGRARFPCRYTGCTRSPRCQRNCQADVIE